MLLGGGAVAKVLGPSGSGMWIWASGLGSSGFRVGVQGFGLQGLGVQGLG